MMSIIFPSVKQGNKHERLKDLVAPDDPQSTTCPIVTQSKFLTMPFDPFPFQLPQFLPIEHTTLRLLHRINLFYNCLQI